MQNHFGAAAHQKSRDFSFTIFLFLLLVPYQYDNLHLVAIKWSIELKG